MKNRSPYNLPEDLRASLGVTNEAFRTWLRHKAQTHVRRDRNRAVPVARVSSLKEQIYAAVLESQGMDAYTGQPLDWHLSSTWDNDEAELGRGEHKRNYWNLPSIDHEGEHIRICSWRMNDSKNDQSIEEFLDLAEKVRRYYRPE